VSPRFSIFIITGGVYIIFDFRINVTEQIEQAKKLVIEVYSKV